MLIKKKKINRIALEMRKSNDFNSLLTKTPDLESVNGQRPHINKVIVGNDLKHADGQQADCRGDERPGDNRDAEKKTVKEGIC